MNDNTLKSGSRLKHGEYRIIRVLGQGGFGITYEAEQVSLGRKVAVKEFFMKEHCNRNEETSQVSVPSTGSQDLVDRYRQKFIREAKMIASLDHEHIVKVIDIFEENGTAYYVMEHIGGGCLGNAVKEGDKFSESEALGYIRQIASALSYLHGRGIIHFDIKPSNVLMTESGKVKLIDFGISKHYDESGVQTSSTPVGISKGYAPLEQYQQGSDIKSFTPATDIYSLGATLYALLSGTNPPEASIVNEDGVPFIEGVSPNIMHTIEKAMQPRRKDRPQSVEEFLKLLDSPVTDDDEETVVPIFKPTQRPNPEPKPSVGTSKSAISEQAAETHPKKYPTKYFVIGGIAILTILALFFLLLNKKPSAPPDSLLIDGIQECVVEFESAVAEKRFIIEKNFEDKWTYSGVPEWCTVTALEGEMVLNVSQNKAKDSRTAIMEFRKKDGNVVLAKLVINQFPPQYTGVSNGHDWVDLGLSVKWATCNVGALNPEDYGDYFAWGETRPKSEYTLSNLKYCNEGDNIHNVKFSKYVTTGQYGPVDNRIILETSDDAASANWGGNWRMPTNEEFKELINNCIWTWTNIKGRKGYKVSSKANDCFIFLPIGSFFSDKTCNLIYPSCVNGYYWSSTLSKNGSDAARFLYINSTYRFTDEISRDTGLSVRPVFD